ncbi:uncharacterized protein L969DRAFT_94449 [Mixia osmundae IAM 14324]|uniref:Uncharacterized protein n=1 Tax=Mixia osmundae (strain CBS 9802 / IAM 14324 / JCM 22182 / KY 12970) TaxID=764103 RepID=G7E3I3_MIXOS|nr:uncharacterized protein L969DRAFT_94449 [Mixia osmundae IAM 14324]KEI39379.1 hypothetical protein L969DRAFT_94449 [Mixia osmundae IAM 14324]GAA97393.1 hypothetical protein E5Q_04070 [Mixia osmundae IAM 14324]
MFGLSLLTVEQRTSRVRQDADMLHRRLKLWPERNRQDLRSLLANCTELTRWAAGHTSEPPPLTGCPSDTFVDACCTRSLCMKSIMGFAPKQNRKPSFVTSLSGWPTRKPAGHFDPPNVFARVRCMIGAPPCHRVPERGLEIPCQFVSPEDREVPFCSVRDFYT